MENNSSNVFDTILCVLSSVMKKWRIILICMMICGIGFDLVKSFSFHEQYVSSISVSLKKGDEYEHLGGSIDYAKTMAYIFESNVVSDYIAKEMEVDVLPGSVKTEILQDTSILKINAYADNVSNAYRMISLLQKWYEENKSVLSGYEMSIVETKLINETPINFNSHATNVKNGAMVAGVFLVLMYVCIFYFRDNVKSAETFNAKIDSRLLGKLPFELKEDKIKGIKTALLISDLRTSFAYSESVKKLCNRLVASAQKHDYKTILFTSSVENEGKSSVTANVALALAKRGNKVLLIDGDMRKPAVKKIFQLKRGDIGKVLRGESSLTNELVYLDKQELFVIGSEIVEVKLSQYEEEWKAILEQCKKVFDYVIVDTAPCRFISDTLNIASMCDACVMVVKQNEAPSNVINDTIYRLRNSGANLIGCVFNASIFDFSKNMTSSHYSQRRNVYKRLSGRDS